MDVGIWLEVTFCLGLLGALASAASLVWSAHRMHSAQRTRDGGRLKHTANSESARRHAASTLDAGSTPRRISRAPRDTLQPSRAGRGSAASQSRHPRGPRIEKEALPLSRAESLRHPGQRAETEVLPASEAQARASQPRQPCGHRVETEVLPTSPPGPLPHPCGESVETQPQNAESRDAAAKRADAQRDMQRTRRPRDAERLPETRDGSTKWPVSREIEGRAARSPRNTEALSETIEASQNWPVSRRVEEQAKRVVRNRTVTQRPDADVTVQYDAGTLARLGVNSTPEVAGPPDMADVVRRADAGQIAYLNVCGLSAVGFVTGIWVREFCGASRMELGVRVTRPDGETYEARAPITGVEPRYRHGEPIAVRYDPKRPQLVAVDRGWVPTVVHRLSA